MKKSSFTCAAIIMSAVVALPAAADLLGTKAAGSLNAGTGTSIQAPGVGIGANTNTSANVGAAGALGGNNDARGGILVNNNANLEADARARHNTAFDQERALEEKPLIRDFKITDKPVKKTRKRLDTTIDSTLDTATDADVDSTIDIDADVRGRASGNIND